MNQPVYDHPDFDKYSLPELLKKMPDPEFLRLAMTGFSDPARIQETVLKQILRASADTETGRKYGFGNISSIDEFRERVPISDWHDYETIVDRLAEGAEDILFPGRAQVFVKTSGTAAGKSKLVPESQTGIIAKQMVSRFRKMQLAVNFPKIDRNGYVLPLSNAQACPPTSAGIPVGFASGIALNQNISEGPGMKFAVPACILVNEDAESRDYLMMRFALAQRNVVMVIGNNAGRFARLIQLASGRAAEIIRDIAAGTVSSTLIIDQPVMEKLAPMLVPDPERAAELQEMLEETGSLLPKDYWPSLQLVAFWISSTVGHYVKDLKPMLSDQVAFFDAGYGASEARINIPSKPGDAAGTLSVYTAFYEFLPADGGAPLLAHQLEDGKSYELVVTTWSGLYRYNMNDIVRVEGFTGNTPNIVFQYKSIDVLNLCDEKIPASLVQDAIMEIAGKMGLIPVQIQIYADPDERRYLCYLETSATVAGWDPSALAEKTHKRLMETNSIYDILCNEHKLLNPVRIIPMRSGWQTALYDAKIRITGSSTQVKLPVMIREKPDDEWIK